MITYARSFVIFSNLLLICDGARILAILPTPSISHQVVFRPLTLELARRGYEVDIITTDPAFPIGGTPENITETDLHDVSYHEWRTNIVAGVTGRSGAREQIYSIFVVLNKVFDKQLQSEEIQQILQRKSDYYVLLLIEACVRPALVFSHIFKAPVIQVSSFTAVVENYNVMGAPTHPILYPLNARRRIHNLTLMEKFFEVHTQISIESDYAKIEKEEDALIAKHFGSNVPPLSKLKDNVDMLFLNMHPILEGNVPVPPGVVYMWGIHQKPVKALPEELQSYLDLSKHGVIYMSFGTNTDPSLLDPEKIQMFVRVFSKLPYNVLWKWSKDVLPGKSDQIRIGKWFPQCDLLKHPKIKLFVTQGGLQSTDEAITAGVPLIGIPMLGDQWFNTEKYAYHKIGLNLDFESITDEIFKNAIETVINDDSYRNNIIRLRTVLNDQPEKALDRAVWWTEYVIRHGGARHLRAPAANISWAQYLELELVFTLFVIALAAVALLILMAYYLFRFITKNPLVGFKVKVS